MFFLTAGAYALATLSFILLAKGEEEPWAKDQQVSTETEAIQNSVGHLHVSVNSGDVVDKNGEIT